MTTSRADRFRLRHGALGSATRSRLLALLREAHEPMSTREIASALGLHPNSAREQLAQLQDAGLVRAQRARPAGTGMCLAHLEEPVPLPGRVRVTAAP